MGTFRVAIDIGDPTGQRFETIEALVDTGATFTTVPAPLLDRLGVAAHTRETFVLADGRHVERDIGRTWLRANGRLELTLVVVGDPEGPALLGAYTLEGLRLAADPVGRRLVPVPALLLVATGAATTNQRQRGRRAQASASTRRVLGPHVTLEPGGTTCPGHETREFG